MAGNLGLESSSPFVRLAQPIETKWGIWLRGVDLNHRPLGYEPNELPDCSTPHFDHSNRVECRQTALPNRAKRLEQDFMAGIRSLGCLRVLPSGNGSPSDDSYITAKSKHPPAHRCIQAVLPGTVSSPLAEFDYPC